MVGTKLHNRYERERERGGGGVGGWKEIGREKSVMVGTKLHNTYEREREGVEVEEGGGGREKSVMVGTKLHSRYERGWGGGGGGVERSRSWSSRCSIAVQGVRRRAHAKYSGSSPGKLISDMEAKEEHG